MSREAILLLNHVLDRHLQRLHDEMLRDCGDGRDVWLLSDRTQRSLPIRRKTDGIRELVFMRRQLIELGYPGKQDIVDVRNGTRNLKLGNAELPVLLFFAQHPEYDRYWLVEYDVRFSGRWSDFFDAFRRNDADLLTTSITRQAECPDWNHWPAVRIPQQDFSRGELLRAFMPVYRISGRALSVIDAAYRRGAAGHMEAVVPTLLHNCGLTLEDMGGDGEFVPSGNANRFYRNVRTDKTLGPGTFIYRPVMQVAGSESGLLWHPVKPRKPRVLTLLERAWGRGSTWLDARRGIER